MRKWMVVALLAAAACAKKHEAPVTNTATAAPVAAATSGTTGTNGTNVHSGDDLVALANGAMIVQKPEAPERGGEAWYMLDEDPATGWTSQSGKFTQPTVIELPDRSVVKSVSFDTAKDEWDGRVAKDVTLEMSDKSATDGFQPIANVTLSGKQVDGETFPVSAQVPGRWLRLTVKSLRTGDIVQIMELRAFGDRLEHNPPPNVTGAYKTDFGELNLKQDGTTVTGCYSHAVAPLVGGMEGRLLKFTWKAEGDDSGPAIAIFSSDGKVFGGHWKTTGVSAEHPILDPFEGQKSGAEPGSCPQ